jgi:hypothetical protein
MDDPLSAAVMKNTIRIAGLCHNFSSGPPEYGTC